jgi:hypothetical protein
MHPIAMASLAANIAVGFAPAAKSLCAADAGHQRLVTQKLSIGHIFGITLLLVKQIKYVQHNLKLSQILHIGHELAEKHIRQRRVSHILLEAVEGLHADLSTS